MADAPGVARQVMEALRSGGGIASLQPLLRDASLTSEQRDLIEFLEFLDGEDARTVDADMDGLTSAQNVDSTELHALRDEVTDLREVNDAAAAALGACRMCWGGDPFCPVCAGQGQPGANLPDQRLYRELVHPAVERMTAGHGRHLSAPTTAAPKFVRFPDEEAQQ